MDKRHKRNKADALKILDDIEKSILKKNSEKNPEDDSDTEEVPVKKTDTKDDKAEVSDMDSAPGPDDDGWAPTVEEATEKMEERLAKETDGGVAGKIDVDFTDYPGLFELVTNQANIDFRTVNQQILYIIHQHFTAFADEEECP